MSTSNYFVDANDVAFDGLDNNSFWGSGGVVRVVQDGAGGTNGVFHYGSGTAVMPSESYNGANYWVDITFDALNAPVNSAPVITSAAALTSPENRLTAGTITATDANVNPLTYAIVGGADAARFTIDAQTGVLRFVSAPNYEAPADAGANNVYDLTVSVSDGIAPAVTQAITVTVTDRAENGITGSNVFGSTDAPTTTETTDPTDYELGMRFTANAAGTITELRYFRGAADASDTDTRVLNLWNAAGVLLGSVTVSSAAGESGWQVGTLSAPIAIQAGATYVVSYGTTQNYAVTANYFTTAHSGPDGVLTAGVASGVFADGTPGAFPTATYNASNYWADVTFVPNSALELGPGHHLGRGADLAGEPADRRHDHRDRRQRQPAHLRDRRRGRRRALHHRRPDRAAALRHRAELRGPGRRGRQQRLRPDRQRQRRHRAGGDPGDHRHRHRPGRERHRLERVRHRPRRRRRPRQPTRPTTSSA